MRPASIFSVASTAACLLASCGTPAPEATKSPSQPARARVSVVGGWIPDTAGRAIVAEAISQRPVPAPEVLDLINDTSSAPLELVTSRVDTTVSLGAWLKSHPVDKITVVAPVSGIDDPFCRGAVAKVQLMGRTFIRSAMFSIPEPPKGEKLPSDTAMVAQDYC